MKKIKLLAPCFSAVATLGVITPVLVSCDKEKIIGSHEITYLITEGAHFAGTDSPTLIRSVDGDKKWSEVDRPSLEYDIEIENGYEFKGWFNGNNEMKDDDIISSDMTIEIKFQTLSPSPTDDFEWDITSKPGEAIVTGYIGEQESINIPSEYDGKPVTEIADGAFSPSGSCKYFYWVSIPGSVKRIGNMAFYEQTYLKTVIINTGVESIGNSAFNDCRDLESINIPSSVNTIADAVFYRCPNITSIKVDDKNIKYTSKGPDGECNCLIDKTTKTIIKGCNTSTIPSGVVNIGEDAFYECKKLESIIIPESVTSIGEYAFYECTGLTSIKVDSKNKTYWSADASGKEYNCIVETASKTLIQGCNSTTEVPGTVEYIDDFAFYGMSHLTSITLHNTLLQIGKNAFSKSGLGSKVIIPDTVTTIWDSAFSECENLPAIKFGSGLKNIKKSAFRDCKALEAIDIPDNVISIGEYAFWCCSGLKSIKIGAGVNSLNDGQFENCENLVSIEVSDKNDDIFSSIDGTPYNCVMSENPADSTIVIQVGCANTSWADNVVDIWECAFYGNKKLPTISIPDSVENIYDYAFAYCSNLSEITLGSGLKFIGSYAFEACSATEATFNGTKAAFETIMKSFDDNWEGNLQVIHCSDGEDVIL